MKIDNRAAYHAKRRIRQNWPNRRLPKARQWIRIDVALLREIRTRKHR